MPATPPETGPGGPATAGRAEADGGPPDGAGATAAATGATREARTSPSPTLVLRPRWVCWVPLPALLAGAAVLVAGGRPWGVALLPAALVWTPVLWVRVEATESTVRRRSWRGRWRRVPLESITAFRLRRLPYRAFRWVRRGYRIGRFWSVPLTLRLLDEGRVRLELRCAWWGSWRALAGFVASLPDVDIDSRSRARLDRYVGPIARDSSLHR